jgi:hypothetical protein
MVFIINLQIVTSPNNISFCKNQMQPSVTAVAYPGILFGGGGGSKNYVVDKGQWEWESGGISPLVRGSGGRCNFVPKISFHIVKFS